MTPLDALHLAAHEFGPTAAQRKLSLLATLAAEPVPSGDRATKLVGLLRFLLAWPDDRAVWRSARALLARLPPITISHPFCYRVVRRLHELAPAEVDLDWKELDTDALQELCMVLVLPGETQGVDDITLTLEDWFERCRPRGRNDLGFLIDLIEGSGWSEEVKCHLFEQGAYPVRVSAPALLAATRRALWFQSEPLVRSKADLAAEIRRPLGHAERTRRAGQPELDFALRSLAARESEIYPLSYADARDVRRVDAGRGVEVMLAGLRPEFRAALDVLFFFLVSKNGVPVGYGPASACAGSCELGINLFPDFRGGEIRALYAAVMRTLHHQLGVDYFFLTRYGMGEHNADAIRTGAFWFYRKLGFRPTNAAVEALAQSEERRMAKEPDHRSDRAMLRRLSHTEAFLDLSGGRCRPLDFGRLGVVESRRVADRFGGDRPRAQESCARVVAKLTRVPAGNRALRRLAVLLTAIPDLDAWSATERRALGRIFLEKCARSEAGAARAIKEHERLLASLRALAVA